MSNNLFAILVEHSLSLSPVLDHDGKGGVTTTWCCGPVKITRSGGNVPHHMITGAETAEGAIAQWLSVYGPNPTHDIAPGCTVEFLGRTGIVLEIGAFDAIVAQEHRAPGREPIGGLTLRAAGGQAAVDAWWADWKRQGEEAHMLKAVRELVTNMDGSPLPL